MNRRYEKNIKKKILTDGVSFELLDAVIYIKRRKLSSASPLSKILFSGLDSPAMFPRACSADCVCHLRIFQNYRRSLECVKSRFAQNSKNRISCYTSRKHFRS